MPGDAPANSASAGGTTNQKPFDLEERTAKFGEAVIRFCKVLPHTVITEPLIRQIVRSATSVGANYCEADDAVSKKEFRQKIGTCKKEARETKHWCRMIAAAEPAHAEQAREIWREASELHLIFAKIYRKVSVRKSEPEQPLFPSSLEGHWWGIRHFPPVCVPTETVLVLGGKLARRAGRDRRPPFSPRTVPECPDPLPSSSCSN